MPYTASAAVQTASPSPNSDHTYIATHHRIPPPLPASYCTKPTPNAASFPLRFAFRSIRSSIPSNSDSKHNPTPPAGRTPGVSAVPAPRSPPTPHIPAVFSPKVGPVAPAPPICKLPPKPRFPRGTGRSPPRESRESRGEWPGSGRRAPRPAGIATPLPLNRGNVETQGDGSETQQRGEFHDGTWLASAVQQTQRSPQRALRLSAIDPRGNPYCKSACSPRDDSVETVETVETVEDLEGLDDLADWALPSCELGFADCEDGFPDCFPDCFPDGFPDCFPEGFSSGFPDGFSSGVSPVSLMVSPVSPISSSPGRQSAPSTPFIRAKGFPRHTTSPRPLLPRGSRGSRGSRACRSLRARCQQISP